MKAGYVENLANSDAEWSRRQPTRDQYSGPGLGAHWTLGGFRNRKLSELQVARVRKALFFPFPPFCALKSKRGGGGREESWAP